MMWRMRSTSFYKNHMGGETFDGASKASDTLNEQIAKMQELNAKAETERAAAEDKMTAMAAEVAKLRATAQKATEAATAAAATATATNTNVQGLAANVGAFGTAVAEEQEKMAIKLDSDRGRSGAGQGEGGLQRQPAQGRRVIVGGRDSRGRVAVRGVAVAARRAGQEAGSAWSSPPAL